jgi:hypothetical protein
VVPSSLVSLVLFVVLLAPGFAYVLRHEKRVPGRPFSVFRETLRVVFVSVACLTVTGLLFAGLRWLMPTRTPNVRGLLLNPSGFAREHHVHLLWWSLALIAFATLIGAIWGDPRLIEKRQVLLSHRALRWVSASTATDIRVESAWHRIFHLYDNDGKGPVQVGVQLDDGSYITGQMWSFNPAFEENQDRELILSAPLTLTTADGAMASIGSQFTIISARRIIRLDVTHLPKGSIIPSYAAAQPVEEKDWRRKLFGKRYI